MEHLLALLIGEVDVHHAHVAAQQGVGQRAVAVGMTPGPMPGVLLGLGDGPVLADAAVDQRDIALVGLGLLIHQLKYTLGARRGHDDGVDLLRESVDVTGKLLGHVQKRDQDADREGRAGERNVLHAREQEHAADEGQRDVKHIADVGDDRPERAGKGVGAEAVAVEPLVDLVELPDALSLMAEYLDDLLAVHGLLDIAFVFGDGLLYLDIGPGRAAADLFGHKDHGGHADKQHERHPHGEIEHDAQHHQHDGAGLDEGGQRLRDELAQRVDVVGVVRHDVAELMRVEIADRQVLHAVEEVAAELVEEALRHDRHELRLRGHRADREQIQRAEQDQIGRELRAGGGPVPTRYPFFDQRDHLLDKQRGDGRDRRGEEDARDRNRSEHGIVAEEHADRADQRAAVRFALGLIHRAHLPCSAADRSRGRSRSFP